MYRQTSLTQKAAVPFYLRGSVGMDIKTVSGYVADGDPNGVWGRELENLKSAYKKIERASRRV